MKEKLRRILKSKKGVTTVQTAVIFIIIMAVFALIIEYTSTVAIGRQIEQTAQIELDSLLMENAMDLFESVKNGRSSILSWQDPDGSKKLALTDSNDRNYREKLTAALGLGNENAQGKQYYRGASDKRIFVIADNDILPTTVTDNLLVVKTTVKVGRDIGIFDLRVPVYVNLQLESRYTKMSAISAGQTMPHDETTTFGNLLNNHNENDTTRAAVKDSDKPVHEAPVTAPSAAGEIVID